MARSLGCILGAVRISKLTVSWLWQVISGRTANTTIKSSIPRLITFGGDHTTTLAALRSTYDHWGKVSVIHFDSHIGTLCAALLEDRYSSLGLVPVFCHFKSSEANDSADTWDPEVLGNAALVCSIHPHADYAQAEAYRTMRESLKV